MFDPLTTDNGQRTTDESVHRCLARLARADTHRIEHGYDKYLSVSGLPVRLTAMIVLTTPATLSSGTMTLNMRLGIILGPGPS